MITLQFWTVLHQLLQREAAAAFHRTHAEERARGVRSRRHRGVCVRVNADVAKKKKNDAKYLLICFFFPFMPSGSQWNTSTTKSSVTWWRKSSRASLPFWYVCSSVLCRCFFLFLTESSMKCVWCELGRRVFKARRCQWHHLPGEAWGQVRRPRPFCDVSARTFRELRCLFSRSPLKSERFSCDVF